MYAFVRVVRSLVAPLNAALREGRRCPKIREKR
jgi:hypothetical protein